MREEGDRIIGGGGNWRYTLSIGVYLSRVIIFLKFDIFSSWIVWFAEPFLPFSHKCCHICVNSVIQNARKHSNCWTDLILNGTCICPWSIPPEILSESYTPAPVISISWKSTPTISPPLSFPKSRKPALCRKKHTSKFVHAQSPCHHLAKVSPSAPETGGLNSVFVYTLSQPKASLKIPTDQCELHEQTRADLTFEWTSTCIGGMLVSSEMRCIACSRLIQFLTVHKRVLGAWLKLSTAYLGFHLKDKFEMCQEGRDRESQFDCYLLNKNRKWACDLFLVTTYYRKPTYSKSNKSPEEHVW